MHLRCPGAPLSVGQVSYGVTIFLSLLGEDEDFRLASGFRSTRALIMRSYAPMAIGSGARSAPLPDRLQCATRKRATRPSSTMSPISRLTGPGWMPPMIEAPQWGTKMCPFSARSIGFGPPWYSSQ